MRAVGILLLTLLLPMSAHSAAGERDEFLLGGLTYHVFNSNGTARAYENKIDSSGQLIANPLIASRNVKLLEDGSYSALTYFGGMNSVNEPMLGAAGSVGSTWSWGRLGIIAGAYLQDNDKFLGRGVQPVYFIPHPGWGLSPVLGVEHVYNITNSMFINSVLSPIICNFSIGWRI